VVGLGVQLTIEARYCTWDVRELMARAVSPYRPRKRLCTREAMERKVTKFRSEKWYS
jgi:hypothetical protein